MAHAIPGRRPVAEALRAGRPLLEVVLGGREGPLGRLADQAGAAGVPVRLASPATLDGLARGVLHQGAVAVAPPFPYAPVSEFDRAEMVVVCDGITDPQNLGAIARSAELAGAGGMVLRERRSVHVTPAVEKASAGALSWLKVALVPNVVRALADLSAAGLWSVGLAGDGSVDLWRSRLLGERVALVVGDEGAGLSRLVADRVDELVSIPTAGHLASLNASAAAAVALFEAARRRTERRSPSPG